MRIRTPTLFAAVHVGRTEATATPTLAESPCCVYTGTLAVGNGERGSRALKTRYAKTSPTSQTCKRAPPADAGLEMALENSVQSLTRSLSTKPARQIASVRGRISFLMNSRMEACTAIGGGGGAGGGSTDTPDPSRGVQPRRQPSRTMGPSACSDARLPTQRDGEKGEAKNERMPFECMVRGWKQVGTWWRKKGECARMGTMNFSDSSESAQGNMLLALQRAHLMSCKAHVNLRICVAPARAPSLRPCDRERRQRAKRSDEAQGLEPLHTHPLMPLRRGELRSRGRRTSLVP